MKAEWPRKEFFYWTDDGSLCGLRYDRWKIVFLEQRGHGFEVWQEPFVPLRFPNCSAFAPIRLSEPTMKRVITTIGDVDRAFVLVPAQAFVAQHLATYQEFPPRQKPGSFSLDQVLSKLQESSNK